MRHRIALAWTMATSAAGMPAWAALLDGVVLIDQQRAERGNVTPGDAPGFPVTISKPGQYRLVGNLTVPDADTVAIEITSLEPVALDLNGLAILGSTRCTVPPVSCAPLGAGRGVLAVSGPVSIANGAIQGMGSQGIHAQSELRVERVQLMHNGAEAIHAPAASLIGLNTVKLNGRGGIVVSGGVVRANLVSDNGGDGIRIGNAGTADANTVTGNAGTGIASGDAGAVNGNAVNGNGSGGIVTGVRSAVDGNTANHNARDGIAAGPGSAVNGNSVNGNGAAGIAAGDASAVNGNAANGNAADGIRVNRGTVTGNTANDNSGFGLLLGSGAGYAYNVLAGNNAGGLQASGGVQTGGNLCNGGACP
jgi:hypothetical protein